MKVAVCGPRKWKRISNTSRGSLVRNWLNSQLDLLEMKQVPLEGVTSLQLGLDTTFASICIEKGIPLTVFLSCKDQDQFWDESARKTFQYILDHAREVIYVSEESYSKGCIGNQTDAITTYISDDPMLFVVRTYKLSEGQQMRINSLENKKIKTFRV